MPDIQEQYNALINALKNAENQAGLLQKMLGEQEDNYREFEGLFMSCKLVDSVEMCSQAVNQAELKLQSSMDENLKKLPLMAEYEALCKQHEILQLSGMKLIALMKALGAGGAERMLAQLTRENGIADLASYHERVEKLSRVASAPDWLKQKLALRDRRAGKPRMDIVETELKTGAIICYGTYPQTKAGNDETPVEWQVLEYDAKNNRALLISRYGLDCQPYNDGFDSVTWETCTLRTWLNGTFLNKAFSTKERRAILTTSVDNSRSQCLSGWSTNGGNNTRDKVFLLSYAEANKYFKVTLGFGVNIKSRVSPTVYARSQGAFADTDYKSADRSASGRWWLRSPGYSQNRATVVSTDGSLNFYYVNCSFLSVRPAFWVDLSGI